MKQRIKSISEAFSIEPPTEQISVIKNVENLGNDYMKKKESKKEWFKNMRMNLRDGENRINRYRWA